jgi:hypothetical protein
VRIRLFHPALLESLRRLESNQQRATQVFKQLFESASTVSQTTMTSALKFASRA